MRSAVSAEGRGYTAQKSMKNFLRFSGLFMQRYFRRQAAGAQSSPACSSLASTISSGGGENMGLQWGR